MHRSGIALAIVLPLGLALAACSDRDHHPTAPSLPTDPAAAAAADKAAVDGTFLDALARAFDQADWIAHPVNEVRVGDTFYVHPTGWPEGRYVEIRIPGADTFTAGELDALKLWIPRGKQAFVGNCSLYRITGFCQKMDLNIRTWPDPRYEDALVLGKHTSYRFVDDGVDPPHLSALKSFWVPFKAWGEPVVELTWEPQLPLPGRYDYVDDPGEPGEDGGSSVALEQPEG